VILSDFEHLQRFFEYLWDRTGSHHIYTMFHTDAAGTVCCCFPPSEGRRRSPEAPWLPATDCPRACSQSLPLVHFPADTVSTVSGLVSLLWYRSPFDQSELSISKLLPTDLPKVRPGRDP